MAAKSFRAAAGWARVPVEETDMTTPRPEPPPTPPPRRPVYYPAGIGCVYWVAILLLIWLIVGLLFRPVWWPWW